MFAGQFVPLKLTTDGNPEWSTWARQYPLNENGIPRLYVIRADGEQLYAGVGALSGDKLPQMLYATLQRAGRSFNETDTALLATVVKEAEEAISREDHAKAAFSLSRLAKLGPPGSLKSYAAPALRADEIAKSLVASSESMIEDAISNLADDDPETMFAGALALADAEWRYGGFANVKATVNSCIKKAKRDKKAATMFAQAEGLVRARRLAASDRESVRRQASQAYETVIRRFPKTPADKIARTELAEISPNSRILHEDMPVPAAQLRVWTDSTGRYSIKATLIKHEGTRVTLRKENGEEIELPANKLSKEDIEFLSTQD